LDTAIIKVAGAGGNIWTREDRWIQSISKNRVAAIV